jgi:hypothetical protein
MANRWSLGVIIGGPVTATLLLAAVVVFIYARMRAAAARRAAASRRWGSDDDVSTPLTITAVAVFAGVTAVAAGCFFPYKAEYHQWRQTTGQVATVSSRFIGDGKSTTQRFVVAFTDGRQRACDDTRCSLIRRGDTLTLWCKRAWQWAATPGYDCNYGSDSRQR